MYERTCRIDDTSRAEKGVISGILATNGEASDGHILNIAGAEMPERMPLLFGHDDFSGRNNLGSWVDFQAEDGVLRGTAQIEMGGSGDQADFRSDVAHMIARGHLEAFSIRWDPTEAPIERTKLDPDHPAHVGKDATGPQRYGLYFPAWRGLEGSVVTIGADPGALIGRARKTRGDLSRRWRDAVWDQFRHGEVGPDLVEPYNLLVEATTQLRAQGVSDMGTLMRLAGAGTNPQELVAIEDEGRKVLLPHWAVHQLQGAANDQLRLALDLRADGSRWDDALELEDEAEGLPVHQEHVEGEDADAGSRESFDARWERLLSQLDERASSAPERIAGAIDKTIRELRMR